MSDSVSGPQILKWIRCSVDPGQRPQFDRAQRAWSSLATVPGFLFQTGGWDSLHPGEAGILAGWRSMSHYAAFMERVHDTITSASKQERGYTRLRTRLFALSGVDAARLREATRSFTSSPSLRITLLRSESVAETSRAGSSTGSSLLARALEDSAVASGASSAFTPPEFLLCRASATPHAEDSRSAVSSIEVTSLLTASEILHESRLEVAPHWVVTPEA